MAIALSGLKVVVIGQSQCHAVGPTSIEGSFFLVNTVMEQLAIFQVLHRALPDFSAIAQLLILYISV